MLSIGDIKRHSFNAQKGGKFYDSAEVDSFFEGVIETLDAIAGVYEKSKRDNEELINKIKVLSNKVEEYRNDEDNLRSALLIAQRAADSVVKEAKEEAAQIISSAEAEAEEKFGKLKAETDEYVASAKAEADKQLEEAEKQKNSCIAEAQSEAASLVAKAEKKAEELIYDAEKKAEIATSNAEKTVNEASAKLASLAKITADFKSSVIDVMNQQISLLESIEIDEEIIPPQVDEVYHPEYTSEEYISDDTDEEIEDESEEAVETDDDSDDEEDEEVYDIVTEDEIIVDSDNDDSDDSDPSEEADDVPAYESTEETVSDDNSDSEPSELFEDIEEIEIDDDEEFPVMNEESESAPAPAQEEEEMDYFDSLMETLSSKEEEKKPSRGNVFTPIIDPDVPSRSSSEDSDLRFGKDYDIFGEDEDESQGSFFGRFKKK